MTFSEPQCQSRWKRAAASGGLLSNQTHFDKRKHDFAQQKTGTAAG